MSVSPSHNPSLRLILLLAGVAVVLWGMSQYASYINSAVLAVLIALATDPLAAWLRRKGVPRFGVLLVCLLVVYVAIAAVVLLVVYAGAQFAQELPTYQAQMEELLGQVRAWLQSLGLASAGAAAVTGQTGLANATDLIAKLLAAVGDALGNMVTLILLTTFLFVDVLLWPGRLDETARRGIGYARRMAGFALDLRQYVVVMVIVCTVVGALNSAVFYALGVPFALLWGVLSGLLNFIPFIGFWIGLLPPAILTLLADGPQKMIVVVVAYVAINAFVQNVVQPKLVVSRLNLTPFMNLVSATFWPLVLGPVGAVIGVPLTMGARALVFDIDPSVRWLADLTSTQLPELPPAPQEPDV